MVLVGALLTLCLCGAILVLGRTPERTAAGLVLAGLAGSLALQAALGFRRQLPIFLADTALTVGFILLTYRHRRVWLAAISLTLIALLVLHASVAEEPIPSRSFMVAVDGLDLVALSVLAGGAVAEARRRRRPTGSRSAWVRRATATGVPRA